MKDISKKRNSSLELLRIIAAMGVIILHYNDFADEFIIEGSFSQYYIWLTNCIFACSVNVFILISAFFLSSTNKRKKSKIVELITQFILFRVAYYVLLALVGKANFDFDTFINLLLPVNYFIILYSVLYVISPYINVLINGLSERAFKRLTFLLICLFSIETWFVDILYRVSVKSYDGLSTVGLLGSQNGFTIVNFVLLYFIGAYMKKSYQNIVNIKNCHIVATLFGILSVMYVLTFIGEYLGKDFAVLNYNSPLVIVFAILVVLIFMKIHIESSTINELSRATFTCYIIHSSILPFVIIDKVLKLSWLWEFLHQTVVVVGVFLVSYMVYKVYNACTKPIFRKIYTWLPQLDLYKDVN